MVACTASASGRGDRRGGRGMIRGGGEGVQNIKMRDLGSRKGGKEADATKGSPSL